MPDEIKAKTRYGELTLDQLAEIQPGTAKIMQEIAGDYSTAYYAAKGGNWKLAAHELGLVRTSFRALKVMRPKYAADIDVFDADILLPILKAVSQKEWAACEAAFEKGIEESDKYHDKYAYGYIRFVLPEKPPGHLYTGPTEGFVRRAPKKD